MILPGTIVWTLGASIGFPAVNLAAVAGTKPGEEGLPSGVISTSFRIGFPLGLAVLLTIFGALDPPAAASVGSYAALKGVVTGFRYALFAAVLLSLLGLALAFRIRDVSRPGRNNDPGSAQPPEPEGIIVGISQSLSTLVRRMDGP